MKDLKDAGLALAEYRPEPSARGEAVAIWLFGIPALPLCLVGLIQSYLGYTKYGPVAAQFWSRPWISTALLLGALALGLALRRAFLHRRRVIVHAGGLLLRGLGPFPSALASLVRPMWLPWDSITGVSSEIVVGQESTSPTFTQLLHSQIKMFRARGPSIKIPGAPRGLQNLQELATRIKSAVYPRRMPELLATFYTGAPLPFGPVTVSLNGLATRQGDLINNVEHFPWSQVRRASIDSGNLVVELERQNDSQTIAPSSRHVRRFPIAQIPNPELLLQLIQEGALQ